MLSVGSLLPAHHASGKNCIVRSHLSTDGNCTPDLSVVGINSSEKLVMNKNHFLFTPFNRTREIPCLDPVWDLGSRATGQETCCRV